MTTPITDVEALRRQLGKLAETDGYEPVVKALFDLVEKLARDNSHLAARYTAALRLLHRPKSERISANQLALFLAQRNLSTILRQHLVEFRLVSPLSRPAACGTAGVFGGLIHTVSGGALGLGGPLTKRSGWAA